MKAVFLDRDGVINEYPGDRRYVESLEQFRFIPGSLKGIKNLYECGFNLFVVSNQAGVAKGIYNEKVLDQINHRIISQLAEKEVRLEGIYYCTHHPEDNCPCRKPRVGLMTEAVRNFGRQPLASFFIGDSFKDMEAARRFGSKSVLVFSGRENKTNRDSWDFEPDYTFDNLLLASNYLCLHYGKHATAGKKS